MRAAAVSRIDDQFPGGFRGSDVPENWHVTGSKDGAEVRTSEPAVALDPGTAQGDWVKLSSRDELIATGRLDVRLELGSPGVGGVSSLTLGVGGPADPIARFVMPRSRLPIVGVRGSDAGLDPDLAHIAKADELLSVGLHVDGGWSTLVLSYAKASLAYSFATDVPPESLCGSFWIVITGGSETRESVGPARITVATDGSSPQGLLPLPLSMAEPGWSVIFDGYSQISQDQWVADVLGSVSGGYFVEIGGDDGRLHSNTLALEERFGWQGLIVEANPRLAAEIRANRSCSVVETAVYSTSGKELRFVDAGPLGGLVATLQPDVHAAERRRHIEAEDVFTVLTSTGDEVLEAAGAPVIIDYLSVDTEGSEVEILQSIDLARWQIVLLTVEHAGRELKRAAVAGVLEPHGYLRQRVWFEDWYWHPGHVAKRLGVDTDEAERRILDATSRIPEIRRARLAALLDEAGSSGDSATSRRLLLEGSKPWYPNNARFVIGAARLLRREGRTDEAIELLEIQPDLTVPVLRELAVAYGAARRPGQLFAVVERLLEMNRDLRTDPALRQALHNVIPARPEVLEKLEEGDHPPRAWALFLDVLGARPQPDPGS